MKRLNIRMSDDDYTALTELRAVLFAASVSDVIRDLVRAAHRANAKAIKRERQRRARSRPKLLEKRTDREPLKDITGCDY